MPLAPVEAEENYIIKKLLVTSASGFLGWNICQAAKEEGMEGIWDGIFSSYRRTKGVAWHYLMSCYETIDFIPPFC